MNFNIKLSKNLRMLMALVGAVKSALMLTYIIILAARGKRVPKSMLAMLALTAAGSAYLLWTTGALGGKCCDDLDCDCDADYWDDEDFDDDMIRIPGADE